MPKNDFNRALIHDILATTSENERLESISRMINSLSLLELEFAKTRIHEAQTKRFFTIPEEILVNVFSYISDIHDLNNCRLTCKRWNRILRENAIWKAVCHKNGFGEKLRFTHNIWNRIFKHHYLTARNWKKGQFSLRHVRYIINPNESSGICTAFDDKWVVSLKFGHREQAKVWNYQTGEEKIRISGHTASVSAVKFNDRIIASGSVDSTIKLWNWSGECIETLIGHTKEITCLHISYEYIISGSEDKTIRVWDLNSKECISSLAWHSKSIICLTVSNHNLIAGSGDSTLSIWDLKSKMLQKVLSGHSGGVQCVSTTSDYIVSGSEDTTIRVWNSFNGKCVKVLTGHTSLVICLALDKEKIISGSADTSIKVWDIKSGYCMYTLKNHSSPVWNLYATANSLISSAFDHSLLEHDFSHIED